MDHLAEHMKTVGHLTMNKATGQFEHDPTITNQQWKERLITSYTKETGPRSLSVFCEEPGCYCEEETGAEGMNAFIEEVEGIGWLWVEDCERWMCPLCTHRNPLPITRGAE